jgi:hypothetical protein
MTENQRIFSRRETALIPAGTHKKAIGFIERKDEMLGGDTIPPDRIRWQAVECQPVQ